MSAREPVTRKRAIRCMMLNLFLLPGAGSLVGGRRSGWWQMLLLALSLVMIAPLAVEMLSKVAQVYESLPGLADDTTTDMPPSVEDVKGQMMGILEQRGALAVIGVVLGLVSWAWAFFTGISLLTEAGRGDQDEEEEEEEDEDDF